MTARIVRVGGACLLVFTLSTVRIATAAAAERHVFVTSVTGTGNLASWPDAGGATGLAAGDAICRARAQAAGLAHPSSYRAWLSTSTTDAWCHLFGLAGKRATSCDGSAPDPAAMGPWLRIDETPFAGTLAQVVSPGGVVYQPVWYDETGARAPELSQFWTGTGIDAEATTIDCGDWESAAGNGTVGWPTATGREWTYASNTSCAADSSLLCLDAGPGTAATIPHAPGALVFLTSVKGTGALASWPDAAPLAGLAGADQVCRNRAAAGFLPDPGTFVAWLSTTTANAADRVTVDGPFVRVDGFVVAQSKAALLGVTPALETAINVTELETYYQQPLTPAGVWTGTNQFGEVHTYTCTNWTTASSGVSGAVGDPDAARYNWTFTGYPVCAGSRPIYCFSNREQLAWDNFERGDLSRWNSHAP